MENIKEQILSQTPFWKNLSAKEQDLVLQQSFIKQFKKDQVINSSETVCMGMVFVQKGSIRVSIISDEGREITLFRLTNGECCVTTASCVIKQITFDTLVSAGEDTALLIIPAALCLNLMNTNIYFKAFIYEKETERFSQAIWVIQELLFKRFDQRLAGFLLHTAEKTGSTDLKLTQEEIARDINSAREVVARMLRRFAEDELVEVKRGHILIKDIQKLKKI